MLMCSGDYILLATRRLRTRTASPESSQTLRATALLRLECKSRHVVLEKAEHWTRGEAAKQACPTRKAANKHKRLRTQEPQQPLWSHVTTTMPKTHPITQMQNFRGPTWIQKQNVLHMTIPNPHKQFTNPLGNLQMPVGCINASWVSKHSFENSKNAYDD